MEKRNTITLECLIMSLFKTNFLDVDRDAIAEFVLNVRHNKTLHNLNCVEIFSVYDAVDDAIFNLIFIGAIKFYNLEPRYYKTKKFDAVYKHLTNDLTHSALEELEILHKLYYEHSKSI
jgi:hypothetical protein